MSQEKHQPLKIGIMCNGDYIHHWQQVCLEQIQSLEDVSICYVIQNKASKQKEPGSKKSNLAYRLLRAYAKPSSYRPINIKELLTEASYQEVTPIKKGKFTELFEDSDIKRIKEENLHLIIRFGFGILRGEVLNVAKYGIWSYHHCDEKVYRGGPAGFWEIYNGLEETGSILQKLTENIDGGIILRKGYFKTLHHSFAAQVDQTLYGSTPWVKQVIIDIRNQKADYLTAVESGSKAKMNVTPTTSEVIKFSLKLLFNRLVFHLRSLFYTELWNIGFTTVNYPEYRNDNSNSVKWLEAEGNSSYLADPFTFNYKGDNYLIYEWYSYHTQKAKIALSKLDENFQIVSRHVLTPDDYHSSYPFLLKKDDRLYVMPETHELNCLKLYELDMNHFQLRNEMELISNFDAVDSSLIYFQDKWWIFCTSKADGSNTNLYIFHSKQLDQPFQPHQNNPVKTSISSARPAGMPFIKNGELYRPAQNSAKTYGHQISIQKVTEISELKFKEEEAYILKADTFVGYNKGIHTLAGSESLTVLDAKKYQFDLTHFLNQLNKKFSKRK